MSLINMRGMTMDAGYEVFVDLESQRQRPDYKSLFNPLPKAERKVEFSRANAVARITDAVQANYLVTLLSGYQNVGEVHNFPEFLRYLMPNIAMILTPKNVAVDNARIPGHKIHYGFGSFVTNPLAAAATGLAIARTELNDKAEEEDSIGAKVVSGVLLVPTGLLAIAALLIDLIKMLVTYAVMLPIAALTAPVTVPMAIRANNAHLVDFQGGNDGQHDEVPGRPPRLLNSD